MGDFALNINKFVAKAKANADLVVRSIVVDVASRIDLRSPVGQPSIWAENISRASRGLPPAPKGYVGGRFRANWQLGVDTRPEGVIDAIDPEGASTQAAVLAALPADAAGHTLYLVNNLPYAQRLEEGWSHVQAPLGMVKLTVLEWQGIVRKAVGGLPK